MKRGFTLIELLVVIAVIGVLSATVLASLNNAREKGSNAAIKSSINNARSQAELYYADNTLSYLNVCNTGVLAGGLTKGIYDLALNAASSNGGVVGTDVLCASDANTWALTARLRGTPINWYCVDSTGVATTSIIANDVAAGADYTCAVD
ncbi:type II secretion system protein [Candidatus Parcubacteria bacterium]|nr:type II secretion system protein [Candidatus Parcubacteria bacterium]